MMSPEIEIIPAKKFIGKRVNMSFTENKTHQLWRAFMLRRNEIQNSICTALYSIEVYPPSYFEHFNPSAEFEKWATVEVVDFDAIPDEMETLASPEGLYAIFIHKGSASEGEKTYQHIFRIWLPQSDFVLDNRPHFAVMGDKYKKDEPDSEEEIWIPVKPRE